MASPTIENGYIRIANELWDEILRRDFSKRQRAIIDFIWRLSYGTQKPYAIIPQLKHFELIGIGKTNITKELKHLEACRVLSWEREINRFQILEDYDRWQLTPAKGFEQDKYLELIHLNIKEGASYQNDNRVIKTITELSKQEPEETPPSYQNDNRGVIKTITEGEPEPYSANDSSAPKDIIKDIKDFEEEEEEKEKAQPALSPLEEDMKKTAKISELLYLEGFGTLGPTIRDDLNYWIDRGTFTDPHDVILEAIKEAARNGANKFRYVTTVLNDWSKRNIKSAAEARAYIEKRYRDIEDARTAQTKPTQTGYGNKRGPVRQEQNPGWFEQHKQETEERERQRQEQEAADMANRSEGKEAQQLLKVLAAIRDEPEKIAAEFNAKYPAYTITADQALMLKTNAATPADFIQA